MNQCICKKDIYQWAFNFNQEQELFENNNILGRKLELLLSTIKKTKKSHKPIEKILSEIEINEQLRKWFLREVKKYSHKKCYGWQCRFKINKINKKCSIHNKEKNR